MKVEDLMVGDRVMLNDKCAVYVREITSDRVIVSKQQVGVAVMSISKFSPDYEDLRNRVKMA